VHFPIVLNLGQNKPQGSLPDITISDAGATVWAALIAAAVALVAAFLTGLVALRVERRRQAHAIEESRILRDHADRQARDLRNHADRQAVDAARTARLTLLRTAAADFSAAAVREVELASQVSEDGKDPAAREELVAAHGELRWRYEGLLLLSESVIAQKAARQVLRTVWNEREVALGGNRKHQRVLAEDAAPAKELRANLRPFTRAVRVELGMTDDLVEEPDD
jgi:uncharacterized membrane protein